MKSLGCIVIAYGYIFLCFSDSCLRLLFGISVLLVSFIPLGKALYLLIPYVFEKVPFGQGLRTELSKGLAPPKIEHGCVGGVDEAREVPG